METAADIVAAVFCGLAGLGIAALISIGIGAWNRLFDGD